MAMLTALVIILSCLSSISCKKVDSEEKRRLDEEGQLLVPELIRSRGYDCERHFVTTEDGYILQMHRIINPFLGESKTTPVLLYHGLLSSSRTFIIASEGGFPWESCEEVGSNLGFELAKRSYDVWLGNTRGNTYSRNHTTFNPNKDRMFWDFSMDELIQYDIKSMIDYILRESEADKLGVIAHSQGTLATLGLMSIEHKYNEIIKPFIALAPVFSAITMKSPPFQALVEVDALTHIIRDYREPFLPDSRLTRLFSQSACHLAFKEFCANMLFMISGFNENQLNRTRLPVFAGGYPAGTSRKNIVHISQTVRHTYLRKFDYGLENLFHYGELLPPLYDLSRVTNKNVVLFSSENDWLATPENVQFIRDELGVKPIIDYVVPHEKWNHFDFLMAIDTGFYINQPIIEILDGYREFSYNC